MSRVPQQGPVLDYASPRPRGKVRLPSRSRIQQQTQFGETVVRERLEGKGEAIFAIGLGVATLVALPSICLQQYLTFHHYGSWNSDTLLTFGIIAVVCASEVLVMLLVINNTWRQTVLTGHRDALQLRMTSPFTERRFEWGGSEIEDIRVERTTPPAERNSLSEIEIHIAGQPVARLFTDHATEELNAIAVQLRQSVGLSPVAEP